MRAYTVTTAAVTLQVSPKWLDNVLSHHAVPGVASARQGVARRLTQQAILNLDIAIRLYGVLSVPIARALELSRQLLHASSGFEVGQGITLTMALDSLAADVTERLAYAVEIAPTPRRGRPARS